MPGAAVRSEPHGWDFAAALVWTLGASQATGVLMTSAVRLATGTKGCYVKVGANPTASAAAGSVYIPPNTVELVRLVPGEKLAAVEEGPSAAGSLSIVPLKG